MFSVLQLSDVVDNKESSSIALRPIAITGIPYSIALSCDQEMLSVCYTANGISFIDIYAVRTLLSSVSRFCDAIAQHFSLNFSNWIFSLF